MLRITAFVLAIMMSLTAMSSGPVWSQQPATTFAEIDLWQKAKDSTDPAVVRAYLEKYPNGEFAPLARARLQQLSAGGAPRPQTVAPAAPQPAPKAVPAPAAPAPAPVAPAQAPPRPSAVPAIPAAAAQAPVETTPAAIREIQLLLYDRGWGITKFDGKMSDELKYVITRWQTASRQQPTGVLTVGQLAAIRNTKPPTQWAAIAYSPRGVSFGVTKQETRSAADEGVKRDCKKRTGVDCTVMSAFSQNCVAFTYAQGKIGTVTHHTTTTGYATEIEAAKENSMTACKGLSKTPGACRSRRVACADGRVEEPPGPKSKRR